MNDSRFIEFDYFLEIIDKQGGMLKNDEIVENKEFNVFIFVLMCI
tara:strand:+ start:1283 stop:1417 length:135 start_codon:yes stop_codon:yes gene_type:complete